MTTTDPTPLAEQIAREHDPRFAADGLGCSCQPRGHLPWGVSGYVQHVATVTEQAVRERIEAEIEAFEPEDRALVHMPDWREAMEDAARIARGGTP